MPRIELAPGVGADFDRIFDHLVEHEVDAAAGRIQDIVCAIDVLERCPLIGRPVETGKRELVIGRGPRGDVALYRFVPKVDTVFVLAVRGQKEAGYGG